MVLRASEACVDLATWFQEQVHQRQVVLVITRECAELRDHWARPLFVVRERSVNVVDLSRYGAESGQRWC